MSQPDTDAKPFLTVRDLNVFRRKRHILKSINCEARQGEVLALIGPNGSGKSTLLKTILKLLPRESGSIELGGRDVHSFDGRELARRMAYMAQETECRWPLDVARVVSLGRMPHQGPFRGLRKRDWAIVDRVMKDVAIDSLAQRTVSRLSGGERQRVLFARALATEPEILLADEPTSGLDPFHQIHLMELFRAQAQLGRTIIVVLHDLTLASRFADRLVLLKDGAVIAQGRPAEVLNSERLRAGYSIEAETFQRDGVHAVVPWTCTRN